MTTTDALFRLFFSLLLLLEILSAGHSSI